MSLNLTFLELSNLEFYSYHGCLAYEKINGNRFYVDFSAHYFEKGNITDNLDDTIDYSLIYNIIRKEMAIPSNLLEQLAKRIIDKIMNTFPAINDCKVTVTKFNPPFDYPDGTDSSDVRASVTLSSER